MLQLIILRTYVYMVLTAYMYSHLIKIGYFPSLKETRISFVLSK